MVPLSLPQLACARIGAVHSVVFAGFSAESLSTRILDSRPKVVVTATGSKRGPKVGSCPQPLSVCLLLSCLMRNVNDENLMLQPILLKPIVDEALDICAKQGHDVQVCGELTELPNK